MLLELVKKVVGYTKHERIIRVIEIATKAVKGEYVSPMEDLEVMMIQHLRVELGEITYDQLEQANKKP